MLAQSQESKPIKNSQYPMKRIILIAITIITNLTFGQETGTYQSDSIYKANKVKARLWYSGTNKKLGITTFYDKKGRLTKYQLEPFIDGAQRTTHYSYDLSGRLIGIADTTKSGVPDQKQIKELKKMGLDPNMFVKSDNNRPSVEAAKYELTYSGDLLVKVTQYKPDGSLDIVDNIKNNGKTKIRDWYRNGKLTEQSTTEYLTEFLKERFYGWEIRDGIKTEWDYKFKYEFDNGRVKSYTRYVAEMEKETVKYFYDEKGLLLKTEGYTPDFFEYIKY
jgi:YD repeat-containing protein